MGGDNGKVPKFPCQISEPPKNLRFRGEHGLTRDSSSDNAHANNFNTKEIIFMQISPKISFLCKFFHGGSGWVDLAVYLSAKKIV